MVTNKQFNKQGTRKSLRYGVPGKRENMRELKMSTKAGQNIYNKGCRYDGYELRNVYDSWSNAKETAYNWCFEQFLATENSDSFSICSHNTFGFTCSWLGTKDGENIMRYETKDNSYLIWLDR